VTSCKSVPRAVQRVAVCPILRTSILDDLNPTDIVAFKRQKLR
jgi:hypothetical protein